MGYATTRSAERVAASAGVLATAPIQFETVCDVPKGGVLLALPSLLAVGLLRYTTALYQLPQGFYGIASIFCSWRCRRWRASNRSSSCAM
jgi:hypothetical protein